MDDLDDIILPRLLQDFTDVIALSDWHLRYRLNNHPLVSRRVQDLQRNASANFWNGATNYPQTSLISQVRLNNLFIKVVIVIIFI
jgi:hypothetical protein